MVNKLSVVVGVPGGFKYSKKKQKKNTPTSANYHCDIRFLEVTCDLHVVYNNLIIIIGCTHNHSFILTVKWVKGETVIYSV